MSARRVAAVMFTDMVGFTALTQRDEPLALSLLDEHRALVRPLFTRFRGREVKTIGDGFMVEFSDALDAAECAVEVQRTLSERNRTSPAGPITLRIGIHLGPVVPEGGDLLGDTVNLSSRILPMAEPGGICLSNAVFEQIGTRLPYPCTKLGPAALKGVRLPVTLYRVEIPWPVPTGPTGATREPPVRPWEFAERESPLVDRVEEIQRLHAFTDTIPEGKGAAMFLSGDAGSGKSRLAREAQAYATLHGIRNLTAVCTEVHSGVPYAPWVHLLRRVVREEPREHLLRLCGYFAADLAKVVPEISEKTGPLAQLAPGGPAEERLRFYDGVSEFFLAFARDQPLLLFFEDIDWADPASLQLLHHFLRSATGSAIGVLGTYRPVAVSGPTPLGRFLGELNRDRRLQSVALSGMSPPSVGQLGRGMLGEEVSSSLADLIHRKTGGNPFFVEEVFQEVIRGGAIVRTTDGWNLKPESEISLPSSVRGVLEERLQGLDPTTLDVLQWASVVGQEFDAAVLNRVVEAGEDQLSGWMDAALRAGLLKEERRKGGRTVYVFRDRPVHEVIYDGLTTVRRRSHHLKVARAIESEFAGGIDDHLEELANHFRQAGDLPKAVDYLVRAAEHASKVYAHEVAADRYRETLELLRSSGDAGGRGRILERLGAAHYALGETERAVECWNEAARASEEAPDLLRAADLYRRIALAYWESGNDAHSFFRYCDAAFRRFRSHPPGPELSRFCAEAAYGFFWFGRAEEGRRLCEEALALSTHLGRTETEALALLSLAGTSSITDLAAARQHFERWKELRGVAEPESRPPLSFDEYLQVAALQEALTGNSRAALRWYDALIQSSHEARFFSQEAMARYMAAGTSGVERMRDECDAILTLSQKFGVPIIDVIEQRLAWRRFYDGDFEGAFEAYRVAAEKTARSAPEYLGQWLHAHDLGSMLMELGRDREARDLLGQAKEAARRSNLPLVLTWSILDTYLRLLQVDLRLGREDSAETVFHELKGILATLDHDLAKAVAAQADGLWAGHLKDWPGAVAHLERSVATWRTLDDQLNLAYALQDLALACQRRGTGGKARAAWQEALNLFERMRAPRHAAIVRSRMSSS